jgi:Domain of unknown function (DUF4382)
MRMKTLLALVLALAGASFLSACGGGGGNGETTTAGGTGGSAGSGTAGSSGVGTLQVSLTDAPSCGYDEVNVTVQQVRVHTRSSAADDDSGWSELSLKTPVRVDLLHLTNGDLIELGKLTLPAGTYTQVRLVLVDNKAVALANSVVPIGGAETPLDTPSAQQSGLKIPMNLVVPDGQVAHLVLDFDACKSIVKAGKSGKFLLKPVISAIAVLTDVGQKVVGCVSPLLQLAATTVSLQQAGVPVRATVPKLADGCFVLYPVPAGVYDLVVAAPGHVTAVMTAVPVNQDSATIVSTQSLPIEPPLSAASYAVAGTVTPTDAIVRALQTLTGGPTVEVAWIPVNSSTGEFGVSLPAGAPVRTSYLSINPLVFPGTLGFVADAAVAGAYSMEASNVGMLTETTAIDISNGPVPPLHFLLQN